MKHLPESLLLSLIMFLPGLAHAHVGRGDVQGFVQGLAHPLGGLDHVCVMLAVGLWAAQFGGRATWAAPLAFVSVMASGALLGMAHIALPFTETGIVMSLLVLGVLIAAACRLPPLASILIVSLFALFHGQAHGAELPHGASAVQYALGFILATALLHACGIGTALLAIRAGRAAWLRAVGVAVMLCGGGLWLAA